MGALLSDRKKPGRQWKIRSICEDYPKYAMMLVRTAVSFREGVCFGCGYIFFNMVPVCNKRPCSSVVERCTCNAKVHCSIQCGGIIIFLFAFCLFCVSVSV
jgi:hypothetical protein